MPRYILKKATAKGKKWMVVTPEKKVVQFGAEGMSDYTINKDPKRRESYLARHRSNENWNDLNSAGAWSRWLLWEATSLTEAIKKMEKKFGIHIVRSKKS
jgi:hypothetical protein